MGDSRSKMADDENDYKYLCQQYGEIEQGIYSTHYEWLNAKHDKRTELSYSDYKLEYDKKAIEYDIDQLQKKLKQKRDELKQLISTKTNII